MGTAHNRKAKGSLFFRFHQGGVARSSSGLGLPLDTTEFFCIGEDEVHVLIKCEHLSSHLSAIVQGNSHPIVDEVLHLSLLVGGHFD